MGKLVYISILILLCSCSLFQHEEAETEKMYVFVTVSPTFIEAADISSISEDGIIPGLVSESAAESEITSFWLSTAEGTKTYISPAQILTPASPATFDFHKPIEIPVADYVYFGLTTTQVASRLKQISVTGDVKTLEVSEVAPYSNEAAVAIYPREEYQPILLAGESSYIGTDGPVYRLEIGLDAISTTSTSLDQGTETTFVELENESKSHVTLLNPKEASELDCLVGKWERSTCDGKQKAYVTFNADGTAVFEDITCDGDCSKTFNFRYSIVTDFQMNIIYTSTSICGAEGSLPDGGTQYFICDGLSLDFAELYTRQ